MTEQTIFLTGIFPPLLGGIAHHLYEITRHLPPEQIQVVGLPTPGWQTFDAQQHFRIRRLALPEKWHPFHHQNKFLAPLYFWHLVRARQVKMILCGHAHHSLMLPAWLMRRIGGTPYGVFVYGLDILRHQNRRYWRLFNGLLCNAQVIFADSRAVAGIVQSLGVRPNRIHVVNPPVNEAKLQSQVSSKTIQQRYGLTGKKSILTVGKLVERKGHDTVLQTLPTILEAFPEVHYLIAGSGPTENSLRALVTELGLEQYVTFAGRIPDEELGAFYEACDIFAMISREIPERGDIEGFGIVYLEANLLAKPVVAGRSGGVTDAVIHNKTGLLVDSHNPTEVAEAIICLLSDPELAMRLGQNGRTRVLQEFTSAAAAQKVSNILEKIQG